MWSRAVWHERNREEEGVIPSTWLISGYLRWPNTTDATRALNEQRTPTSSWQKFKLIKVKMSSDNKAECDDYDETTATEVSDVEDVSSVARTRKAKVFEDCVTDGLPKPPAKFTQRARSRSVSPSAVLPSRGHSRSTTPQNRESSRQTSITSRRSRSPATSIPSRSTTPQNRSSVQQSSGRKTSITSRRSRSPATPRSPVARSSRGHSRSTTPQNRSSVQHSSRRQTSITSRRSRSPATPRSPVARSSRGHSRSPTPQNRSSVQQSSRRQLSVYPMTEARFQKRVLYLLNDIRETLQTFGRQCEATNASVHLEQMDTVQQILDLERDLTVDPAKQQLVISELSKLGGTNVRDCTKKIMHRLFTNQMMASMNMKGGGNKFAFGETTLFKVVSDSVLRTQNGTFTDVQVAVTSVLKYAPDRKGGGGRHCAQ